jgi:hypothetical protein
VGVSVAGAVTGKSGEALFFAAASACQATKRGKGIALAASKDEERERERIKSAQKKEEEKQEERKPFSEKCIRVCGACVALLRSEPAEHLNLHTSTPTKKRAQVHGKKN